MDLDSVIAQAESMSAFVAGKTLVLYAGLAPPNIDGIIYNSQAALQLAAQHSDTYYTIFQTPAGSYLDDQFGILTSSGQINPLDPSTQAKIAAAWQAISLNVAQQAQGPVIACALSAGPTSVFTTTEYGAIRANTLVPSINGILTTSLPTNPLIGAPLSIAN